jgi:NADH-quinone oxidoreductase subunit C
MSMHVEALAARVESRLAGRVTRRRSLALDCAWDVPAADLVAVATALRDEPDLRFEMLVEAAGVDYHDYGRSQWRTNSASSSGFGRGVNSAGQGGAHDGPRFAMVYQLLSITHNERLSLRAFCPDNGEPALDSLVGVWAGVNWFEREAFDLFGIVFGGHPDLRRLLTDYGFIGHPFRKDFPLVGNVEVRYDEARRRVVYEPVEITERTLVPRVIRDDNRWSPELTGGGDG